MEAKHSPMVVAAAREMCRLSSEACGIDNGDNWKIYGHSYLEEAETVLAACGAPELLEALKELKQLLDIACSIGAVPSPAANGPAGKALAAIAKATGSQQ